MVPNHILLLTFLALTCCAGCATDPEQEAGSLATTEALSATPTVAPEPEIDKLFELLVKRIEHSGALGLDETRQVLLKLTEQRHDKALGLLARCARDDPHEDVRLLALDAIHSLGSPQAAGLLMRASVNDPSQLVQRRAWELLLAEGRVDRERTRPESRGGVLP